MSCSQYTGSYIINVVSSVVNKDLSFKAKAKAKDLTFKAKAKDLTFKTKAKAKDLTSEHVQGPL